MIRPRLNCFTLLTQVVFFAAAFAQAKAAAKKASNTSNLKQIALAVTMYNGDYDDMMTPYALPGDGPATGTGSGTMWWHGRTMRMGDTFFAHYLRNQGLIYPYMKNAEIQDCPVGKSIPTPFTTWKDGNLVPAYATNNRLWVQPRPATATLAAVPAVNMGEVEEPAGTILMVDGVNACTPTSLTKSFFISPTFDVPNARDNGSGAGTADCFSSRVHGRHSGMAVVAWADGHVTARRPTFRSNGTARQETRRLANIGELAPVALPAAIAAGDPQIPEYNRFWSLNKALGW
jgi:prepilin-type processing-associated H-X9-DG protein